MNDRAAAEKSTAGGCTVECVAERGGPVALLRLGSDGAAAPWLGISVRPVPALHHATVGVCALAVVTLALAARPAMVEVPGWVHAALGVLATLAAWLIARFVAAQVLARIIESVATDTATSLLTTEAGKPCAVCPATSPPAEGR